MRKTITLFVTLLVFALGCSATGVTNSQTGKPGSQTTPAPPAAENDAAKAAEVMKELRLKFLTAPPEEVGITKDAAVKVWGLVVDTARPVGVVTVLSMYDGTASIYTTTGGAVIGGYRVKAEAQAFVAEAEKQLTRLKPAESFPYPEQGRVTFYVRTPGGVYTAEASQEELVGRRHPLSPLYEAGNKVGATLWEASTSARPEEGGR